MSADQLYASFTSHERKHFRQIKRKLTNDFAGRVRIERQMGSADLERSLEVVEQVSRKTWQQKLESGLTLSGPLMEFFKVEADKLWLRIYTLYLADEACAFWIGAAYQGTFVSDFVGYDPVYGRYSPGMYLLSQMMEEFCADGIQAVDFGFSDEEYKRRFGNTTWKETSLYIFAPTLKGLGLASTRFITVLLHEPIRAVLARTNLIHRAKKLWRQAGRRKNGEAG